MIRFIYISRPPSNGNDPERWHLTIGMEGGEQRVEQAKTAIEALRAAAKAVKADAPPAAQSPAAPAPDQRPEA